MSDKPELQPLPPPIQIPFGPTGLNQVAQSVVLLAREVQQLRNEFDQLHKRKKRKKREEIV